MIGPNHLQYIVKTKDDSIQASFEFEPHAIKYIIESQKAKDFYIEPNPSPHELLQHNTIMFIN